jgi:hypothetical protein
MRGTSNQERLFREMRCLKAFLKELTVLADKSSLAKDYSGLRRSKNLKILVTAGREFYIKASSAASDDFGWIEEPLDPSVHRLLHPTTRLDRPPSVPPSEPGDLSDKDRAAIKAWQKEQTAFEHPGVFSTDSSVIRAVHFAYCC